MLSLAMSVRVRKNSRRPRRPRRPETGVEVPPADASRVATSSLERDFCRRRRTRQKGPEDDISAQSPEIGDHHVREMAAKTAFLLTSCQLLVSEDWVVG